MLVHPEPVLGLGKRVLDLGSTPFLLLSFEEGLHLPVLDVDHIVLVAVAWVGVP